MSGIQGKISSALKGQGTAAGTQLGDEVGGAAGNRIGALQGVIAGATAAIVNKGLEVAGAAIKNFVDSASNIQSLRASFESLTGSVDATNKVMNTLYTFGKQTAFSNEDIQSAGRAFLAVGQNADQMQVSLKMAGDIAGATGANLGQLVLPLTQAYARGSLQTQDFYQILNSGAGALRGTLQQVVAAKTGITNLGDAMSQGKVTSDLLWQAMQIATSQGGFAFQGAIKQSETFNGRMSNLKEAITNVGLGMLGVNAATGEVDSNGVFAKFSNTVQGLVNYLSSSNFQNLMKGVADGLSNAINALAGAIGFIVQYKDIFAPIAVAIGVIVTGLVAWTTATKIATAVQAAFNAVMAMNPIGLIVLAIAALVAGLVYFFTQTKTGQAVWASFMSFLMGVWDGLKAGFAAVANFFSGIWSAITGAISGFLSWFGQNWRIIIAIVLGPLGLLIDFVTAYWSEISGAIQSAVSFIWGVISGVFNAIAGFMGAVFGPPINAIVGVFRWLAGAVGSILGGIWGGISGVFGQVTGFLGGVGGTIMRLFAGAGGWLVDAGRNIINGLINGASSLLSRIGSMFLDIIPGWIKEPFKKALGIHSPSTVFAGFGDNITQGLINGVVANAGGVTDAVGTITDAAMTPLTEPIAPNIGVNGSIATSGAGGGNNTTQTVSIQQVILATPEAAKEFFKQLNQDTLNTSMGITPVQGAYN